MKKNWQG